MQRDELLAGLTPALRQMYRVFEQHGPMTAEALRDPRPLDGVDGAWKGQREGGGRTSAIQTLQAKGLIYESGVKGRRKSRVYTVTPDDQIEAKARTFARRRPTVRKRDTTGGHARIHEYRRMEREAGHTSRGAWIKARRQVVEFGRLIRDIDPMLYWSEKTVPPGELEQVYDEMVLVAAYLAESLKYVEANRTVAKKRLTINALLRKAESTEAEFPGEARVYREKARELQDGLDEAA